MIQVVLNVYTVSLHIIRSVLLCDRVKRSCGEKQLVLFVLQTSLNDPVVTPMLG